MKTVSVRVQDDVYMQFRKHLLNKAIDNGMGVNMSAYIVKLIENYDKVRKNVLKPT
jgi:hypothetical protein